MERLNFNPTGIISGKNVKTPECYFRACEKGGRSLPLASVASIELPGVKPDSRLLKMDFSSVKCCSLTSSQKSIIITLRDNIR